MTSWAGKKIYVVEDSAVVSLELQKKLEYLGFDVVGASVTGEDAVTECLKLEPDLILMDIQLPGGISGIEAARRIRSTLDVPIIYTTAYSDDETVSRAQETSPFGYLLKPYDNTDLRVAIMTAFTRYRYEKMIEASENRYRGLFEGSMDMVFTLDAQWRILTVNTAVNRYLKVRPEDLHQRSLLDLVYDLPDRKLKSRELIREKLEHFSQTRMPLVIKVPFVTPIANEPVTMSVRMEYINQGNDSIVLARAYRIVDDELLPFFVRESQTIVIGNHLIVVEEVTRRATRNLRRYIDGETAELLRLALAEIIINAIEHGNLEISFEEKGHAMEHGDYLDFIAKRREQTPYNGRRVTIDFSINPEAAHYTVADEGPGFDYEEYERREAANGKNLLSHGRGIRMVRNLFDEVTFGDRGTRVTLIKRFPGGAAVAKS